MLTSNRTTNILLIAMIAVGIGIVAMLASGVRGGPLDPQGPPSSTYKTLEVLPPIWVLTLPSDDGVDACNSRRFTCVMNGDAVLDRETGLVWERAAGVNVGLWTDAVKRCQVSEIGGRKGWRLPTIAELGSLVNMAAAGLKLPASHPFTGLETVDGDDAHWSITDDVGSPSTSAVVVFFASGVVQGWSKLGTPASLAERVMCVRTGESP